jgi:anti-sigma factor RsiW
MNDAELSELMDKAMAGRLTAEEQTRWNALLAKRPELDEDVAVGIALQALPEAPAISSNFTARVLEEIRREERADERREPRGFLGWLRWPKLARASAFAALAVALSFAGLEIRERQEVKAAAKTFVGGVNRVAESRNGRPDAVVAVFQDFEAIRNLSESSDAVDYKLLTALGQ